MKSLILFFNCGAYYKVINRELGYYIVQKFSDLNEKIIPFFEKYNVEGVKTKDFKDFSKVVKIIANKDHLTVEGLKNIRVINSNMNRSRNSGVDVLDENCNLIYKFDSIKECAQFFSVSDRTIVRRIAKRSLVGVASRLLIFKNSEVLPM
jgi:hypothetical protein